MTSKTLSYSALWVALQAILCAVAGGITLAWAWLAGTPAITVSELSAINLAILCTMSCGVSFFPIVVASFADFED